MATASISPSKLRFSRLLLVALGITALAASCALLYDYALIMLDRGGTYDLRTFSTDIDGDGDLDVLLHHTRNETEFTAWGGATLWVNQGDGAFAARSFEDPIAPNLAQDAAAGDVDRDGDPDLIGLAPVGMVLMLNQGGDGLQFELNQTTPPPEYSSQFASISLGDLDNDGEIDGFVASCCETQPTEPNTADRYPQSNAWVWRNEWDPRGWLERHTAALPALDGVPIWDSALGDLNGDGSLDVYAAVKAVNGNLASPADRVLYNDGAGNLRDSEQRLGDGSSYSVALGDLDADGDLDALVGGSGGAQVWLNQGGRQGGQEGVFAAAQSFGSGQAVAVYLADFDHDSRLDALIAGQRRAVLWWNDGAGKFTRSNADFRYSHRHGLAVADFNGDGSPDVFAGEYAESYLLWLNRGDGVFTDFPGH